MSSQNCVYLQCIRVRNRLRVRIISNNYVQNLNCQFPRALRIENQIYSVPPEDIQLVKRLHQDFYSIGKRNIELIEDVNVQNSLKIYTEEDDDTCCICLDNKKHFVFISCGHYYVCKICLDHEQFTTCPICRSIIIKAIPFDELKH